MIYYLYSDRANNFFFIIIKLAVSVFISFAVFLNVVARSHVERERHSSNQTISFDK